MSFNKITIIGNLGRDPELRYTPQGNAVCDFSVAVNDRKRDKAGEWQDIVTWFKITLWGKQAETASKYLTKGRQIYIEGRLQLEEWTDRDGNNRYTLAVQGSEIQFLGDGRGENTEHVSQANVATSSGTGDYSGFSGNTPQNNNDDDIPF
ncbi:MAG: single-stranded DNA-binding protein [Acidobacteria bacterium]|nr:single-stranded DNA-binding protein [Acidobacteriota bacterium]